MKKIKQSPISIYGTHYVIEPTYLHLLVLGPCLSQQVLRLTEDPSVWVQGTRRWQAGSRCGVRLTGTLMTHQPQSIRPLRTQNLPSDTGHVYYQLLE